MTDPDFYLVYALNSNAESGFYVYDTVSGTFQRFIAEINEADVTPSPSLSPSETPEPSSEPVDAEQNNFFTPINFIMILGAIFVILLIVVVILTVKHMKRKI